jgi:hypothetical protein
MLKTTRQAILRAPFLMPALSSYHRLSNQNLNNKYLELHKNSIVLNTMRKSGSHYLMSVLGNYVFNFYSSNYSRVDLLYIKSEIFNSKLKEEFSKVLKVKNIHWQHENIYLYNSPANYILHTYRNPLDSLVSRIYYNYINRSNIVNFNMQEAIDESLFRYALHYHQVKFASKKKNIGLFAYEDMILQPENTFKSVLHFLEIEYDSELLLFSIDASRKSLVKKDEKKYCKSGGNFVAENSVSSFVRSGKVGEWVEVFSDQQVEYIFSRLKKYKINVNEFIIEGELP